MQIDKKVVQNYYDKKQILNFNEETAKKEQKIIMPYILKKVKPSILDLGCGNGRYARLLKNHYIRYTGVDFSVNFIEKCQQEYYKNCKFIWDKVEDFCEGNYDVILLFGVIVYLNDEDIKQVVKNCKKMLNEDGIIIVRDILTEIRFFRKNKMFHTPYQQIRRTEEEYYDFFNDADFYCDKQFAIPDTGFTGFIFKVDW